MSSKTGYTNGTRDYVVDEPRHAHRKHHCLDFILRVLTAMATGAAIITLLKSNQTVRLPSGAAAARVRWNDFGSFKYVIDQTHVVCL